MKSIHSLIFTLLLFYAANSNAINSIESVNIECDSNKTAVSLNFLFDPDYYSYDLTNPCRLLIDVSNIKEPEKPFALDYCSPVERINFQPLPYDSSGLSIVLEYLDGFDYSIKQAQKSLVVEFPFQDEGNEIASPDSIRPAWFDREINLVVDGGQVSSALNLISKKAGFDIVISDLNDNQIWVNFQKVKAGDALRTILNSSGNSYQISGNVVVVTNESSNIKSGLETRVYDLKYQDAEDFKTVIKDILSPQGKIEIVNKGVDETAGFKSRSRTLLITDTAAKHNIIEKIIKQIDRRPLQIAISVKFIETNISDEKNLGVDWNKVIETQLTGADAFGITEGGDEVSNYSAYSSWPPEKGSFEYGTLTISEAKAVLNYLHDKGESRLLSDPSVTTSDGKRATISVTTTIPIQTINRFSEGAVIQDIVTYEYKEVGIVLNVTPFINDQGRITLLCEPQVEEITGWVGPQNSQQPITTKRSVRTEIVVVNGETVVIGGLYKEGKIKNESKIWLLGDLPLLGWLFKTENTVKNKTDLLIFITPEILQ